MCAAPVELGALMHGPKFCAGFRGELTEEASAAINVLRAHWPAAFPQSPDLIRPLANDVTAAIAERTGWSKRYTASVLAVWRRQPAYAKAVLRYDRRYDLAGTATEQLINDHSRERAREQIARIR
jgi:sRNA-binding protein